MQYTENDIWVMYLQPSRWKLFIDMQTCFTREEECCGYEEGEKEQKTVKFGQQERKRALNLVCKGHFPLWWNFEEKAIVYVHLTIKFIEHTSSLGTFIMTDNTVTSTPMYVYIL